MAKAKETPRQKMIGMMYLVLTALLALNVSTTVLDAFSIIDEGLNKTAKTIQNKNEEIYKDFDKQYAINETKVSSWRNLALEVKEEADKLYKHIQDLKVEVVIEARDEEAIEGDIIHRDKIKSVTDYDTPKRVMIGSEYREDCKATKLKNMVADYRNFLLNLVKEENVQLRSSITHSLNTDDPEPENVKGKSREKLKWEEHKFGHSPLVGFLAIMSSLQIDIKNAESEVIKYLFAQIEAGAVKFNEIEAVVVHNSNYIIKGNEYQAQIFLAARDTTQPPKVWVAQGDHPYAIVRDSLGNIKYERKEGLDYQSLPVEGGKGVYRIRGTSMGYRKWGGIIEIPGPGGDPIRRPFTEIFQVAEGNVVVSPTKMNLFYLGVDNPVDISVAGLPPDKVYARMTNGTITRSRGGSWIVRPRRPGNSYVIVSAEIDGTKREVDRKEFRVKTVPTPQAMVNNQTGGAINKNILLAQTGVAAVMENFEFDLTFTVTEFKVLTIVQGFVRDASSKSNRFTQKQRDIIRGLSKGSPLYIQDIKAVGPDGSVRNLQTINFRIN